MLQEPAFAFEAAAGEGAVGSDDAMAGDDDTDGINAVGQTDRADCRRAADSLGELAVGLTPWAYFWRPNR